jgi:CBS-domain-containing membrane protein
VALAAPIEPLEHQAMHRMVKLAERAAVVSHPKVVEVPAQLACDRPPQVRQRTRHTFRAQPVVDVDQRPPQPPLGCLTLESAPAPADSSPRSE